MSATPQLITALLTSFLPGHRRRHPGIAVQLIEGSAVRQRIQLESGEIDLAIMPASDTRFPGRLLFPVHVLAVVPKTHRLAWRAVIDVAEIADEPLLLLQPGFGSRATFDSACEIAQINPRVLLECTAAHTLISLVAVGYGVAVVPSTAISQEGKFRTLTLLLRGASIGYWEAVCSDGRRLAPIYLQPFVNELVAHCNTTNPRRKLMRRAPTLPRPGRPFS